MSLFSKTGSFTSEDISIQAIIEKTYREAITLNISYWAEADVDTRFRAGDQTLWNDLYGNLPAFRRRQFNFNRVRRICNMITGYQRQHKKSLVCQPREPEDQQTADQMTKLLYWADTVANTNEKVSQAFDGAITTGMTLMHVWWDFREDPINGKPQIDVLQYNDFLIDPYFRNHDLSDCNYIWRRRWLSNQDVASLLPEQKDTIMGMEGAGFTSEGKFLYQPEAYSYGQQDLLTYDEYYYRDYRSGKMIVDPETGDTLEWAGSDQSLKEYIQLYPHIEVVDQIIPTVKVAILVNGKVMYHGRQPLGDSYPFVVVLAYYEPQIPYFPFRVQGVVRNLRDSQYLYNRRKIIELDILESIATSGFIYREGSLVDPKSVFLTGQGRGIAVKKDAEMGDVQPIQPPQVPPSMMQISDSLGNEIMQISGVNEELLGSAEDDKAGVLSMLRQGAGLVTLQILFDQLDQSVKQLGKIIMQGFQHNFSVGKVARIINEVPNEQFFDRFFSTYDCVVEEGALTATQRQLAFQKALHLKELGIPIPIKYLLDYAQLPDKKELMEDIEQEQQQQQQQQQQQAQVEQETRYASLQAMQAKTASDRAMAAERIARSQYHTLAGEERIVEMEKDSSQASLNEIKAVKELEQIDLDQLQQFISIIKSIKKDVNTEERFEPFEDQTYTSQE